MSSDFCLYFSNIPLGLNQKYVSNKNFKNSDLFGLKGILVLYRHRTKQYKLETCSLELKTKKQIPENLTSLEKI